MTTREIAAANALLLFAALSTASADPDRSNKAGLPVDTLTPPGMVRVRVVVPAGPGLPVRLVYRHADQERPALLVDVWIGDTAEEAHAALIRWQGHWARQPRSVANLGDAGFAAPGLVAFCRHNVAFSVRRVAGGTDVERLARSYVSAVDGAPDGSPRARSVRVILPEPLPIGPSRLVRPPSGVLAMEVTGQGPAAIRRTQRGWRLRRTGPGHLVLQVVTVDALLRVSRRQSSFRQ